jgi:hypothetical protein
MKDGNAKVGQGSSRSLNYCEKREHFLNLELETAITFCQTGLAMRDRTRAKHSAVSARKALGSFEKMAPTMTLRGVTRNEISEKLVRARSLLSELERHLQEFPVGNIVHACPDCDIAGEGKCRRCRGTGKTLPDESFGQYHAEITCSRCKGSGECPSCGGTGETEIDGEG